MAQNEQVRERLLEKANTLPLSFGVYIMRDRGGKVVYVGKSRKLRNRVSQYFQNGEKDVKTSRMVASVAEFDYYLCDNEMEALSLENTLIKQYSPKYNIRLKDAKSYPYIKLTEEEYPRLVFTRKREGDKAKYFGPFSGAGAAYALIELLSRTFSLPTCKRSFPRDIGRERPCIYYQMGRCCGVCTGKVSPEEYRVYVRYAAEVLGGKVSGVREALEKQMYACAEEERYEAAARCRDTLSALDRISQKQKVVASPDTEQDVVALYSDDFCTAISVFYIRAGVLQDKADFLFGADSILEAEDLSTFLCEHYKSREYIPHEILFSRSPGEEEERDVSAYLSGIAGHKVTVHTPERGSKRTLCEMVEKNAADRAKLYREDSGKTEDTLATLASMLALECYPERIEAYDISNLGSEHLRAGMIVCKDGKFEKADYRSFRIQSVEGTDDYASMREALSRRMSHLEDVSGSFSRLPDLILLDGGRGHVSTVRALLAELGLAIPVFGMVKDEYHKTRTLCTDCEEIDIARRQDVFSLIYRIQEEVHRYTVGGMQSAKRKTLRRSSLTEIAGIGEAKAKRILAHFGGLAAVREVNVERLMEVVGIGEKDARAIRTYFEQKNEEKKGKGGKTN